MQDIERVVRYEPHEKAPHLLAFGLSTQLTLLVVTSMAVVWGTVIRAGGIDEGFLAWAVFGTLLACCIATLLQVTRIGRIGAGYVLLMGTSEASIAVCLAAMIYGGPALLGTLVLASGVVLLLLSRHLTLVRRILTPTVTGTMIMLIAASVMPSVFEMLETADVDHPAAVPVSAGVTMLAIVVIALRVEGAWRLWGPVIGVSAGCLVAVAYGHYDVSGITDAAWFGVPDESWPGLDLSFGPGFWSLFPAFVFVMVLANVETVIMGASVQRVARRQERAVNYRVVERAVAASGVANLIAGLLASVPITTYSSSVAAAELTGVSSRRVGYYAAGSLAVLAFCPKALAVFIAIPHGVAGAYLLTILSMLFVFGMRVLTRDGMGNRKVLIVGISFWMGMEFQHRLITAELSVAEWHHFLGNGVVSGGLVAIALTLFVELTTPRPKRLDTTLAIEELPRVLSFLDDARAKLGLERTNKAHLAAVAEEAILALLEDLGPDAPKRRLRVTARADGASTVLEFFVGSSGANLEDRLADLGGTPGLLGQDGLDTGQSTGFVERDMSLRMLGHRASSVRYEQYHDMDVLTVRLDRKQAGKGA